MTRKMTRAESDAVKARVLAMLSVEPLTGQEIAQRMDVNGRSLGNMFTSLLREKRISRFQWRKGQYCYYIGDTAPAGSYEPARRAPKPKPATVADRMAFPVKQTRIWVGDRFNAITIPAAPWETAA